MQILCMTLLSVCGFIFFVKHLLDRFVLVCYFVITKALERYMAADDKQLDINNLPDLLTVREVAELLRVSPLTIKRWGKRGKLTPIRINSRGDRRYRKEAVLYLLGIQPQNA